MSEGFEDASELERAAVEAYVYLFPLVLMELTRRQSTNVAPGQKIGRGPMNSLIHARTFPPASFRTVVRPNFDTLYSSAWLDLREEPLVFSIPALADRFFMLPFYDMWTEVFASPGTRTTGRGAYRCALCLPQWRGELPAGVQRIVAPTPIVWVIGRTETRGTADYDYIHAFQDQLTMTPLSQFAHRDDGSVRSPASNLDETIDMKTPPMVQTTNLSTAAFFDLASQLVTLHPPHATDWNTLARLERLGFVVGEIFSYERLVPDVRDALEHAAEKARGEMLRRVGSMIPMQQGWRTFTDTMGVWGNFYLKRALIAMTGLGANPVEESVYPSLQFDDHGEVPDGRHTYRLRFARDQRPPVRSFWSLTLYDPQGFQVANELERFALGDRDDLAYDADGSLEIVVATQLPPGVPATNWLPAPEGPFTLTMRLYWPEDSVFDGRWSPPPLERREN